MKFVNANPVLLGDVNGDGVIDVHDISATVSYLLGYPTDKFIKANADIDGNDDISVTDVMGIVNIILGF